MGREILSEETYQDLIHIFAHKSGRTAQGLEKAMTAALEDMWRSDKSLRLMFPGLERPPTLREVMPLLLWAMKNDV